MKQYIGNGALAQLGARIAGSDEVTGSSPVCSTIVKIEVSERKSFSCPEVKKPYKQVLF